MIQNRRSRWISGIGGMLMASAALLWFVNPAGAIPLESWDDKIPIATQRFKVLTEFGGAAVLDKETGLVWERAPDVTGGPNSNGTRTWSAAVYYCLNDVTIGGRKGWRLPSVVELASLVDPANSNPALPTGHPFSNVHLGIYWSGTTQADNPFNAWDMFFSGGFVGFNAKTQNGILAWCVRGPMQESVY